MGVIPVTRYKPCYGARMDKERPASQVYTANEAATILGVSPRTIRRRAADGSLPSIELRGIVRIPRAAIDALISPAVELSPRHGDSLSSIGRGELAS